MRILGLFVVVWLASMLNMFNCLGVQVCAESPSLNQMVWDLTIVTPLFLLFSACLISKQRGRIISLVIIAAYSLLLVIFKTTVGMIQIGYCDFEHSFTSWEPYVYKTSRIDDKHTITTIKTFLSPHWHQRLEIELMPGVLLRRSLHDISDPDAKI